MGIEAQNESLAANWLDCVADRLGRVIDEIGDGQSVRNHIYDALNDVEHDVRVMADRLRMAKHDPHRY